MAFISDLIGRSVADSDGNIVGKLHDLVARFQKDLSHPVIVSIVIQTKKTKRILPYSGVAVLIAPAVLLKSPLSKLHDYFPQESDIFLCQEVLDRQIIDTDGARVVRVNDLELVRANGMVLISNVDVGGMGILRRLGLARPAQSLANRMHWSLPQTYISWDDVELMRRDQAMRLRVPGDKLADLHPADIAEIISDLNRLERRQLLESLDVEHLADALEEVEPDFQASLVEEMDDEQVADVLEEMEPDEAADLLAEFPAERSNALLSLMEKDEAADVRKLLSYPVDSAGGLMTTEFATIPAGLTAQQAIETLRTTGCEAETIYYVYVTDRQNHLLGVFSLSRLIFEKPETPVAAFMQKRVISVSPLEDQDQVAQMIAKYDLLAIPVVDESNCLQGIVTSDDALDKIIPTAWKKRLPRFYR